MRTCPNRNCRVIHDDAVSQCPECGAPMGREPDAPLDPNSALYAARDRSMREKTLANRLASRANSGRGQEIDTNAPVPVREEAQEMAAAIFGLYGLDDAA